MPFPTFGTVDGADLDEVLDSLEKQRKEMQWLLQSLDTLNVKELSADVINAGTINVNLVRIFTDLTGGLEGAAYIEMNTEGIKISNGLTNTFTVDMNGDVVLRSATFYEELKDEFGVVTGGNIVIDPTGILANNGTQDTFAIDVNGNAFFMGNIEASNITGSSFSSSGEVGGVTSTMFLDNGYGLITNESGTGAVWNANGFHLLRFVGSPSEYTPLYMSIDPATNGAVFGADKSNGATGGSVSFEMEPLFDHGFVVSGGIPLSDVSEGGVCGVGGMDAIGTSGAVAGVSVNFRLKKTYTPSSVSLSSSSSNTGYNVSNITNNGFWLYVEGGVLGEYYYWRGTYSA